MQCEEKSTFKKHVEGPTLSLMSISSLKKTANEFHLDSLANIEFY